MLQWDQGSGRFFELNGPFQYSIRGFGGLESPQLLNRTVYHVVKLLSAQGTPVDLTIDDWDVHRVQERYAAGLRHASFTSVHLCSHHCACRTKCDGTVVGPVWITSTFSAIQSVGKTDPPRVL